VHADDQLTIGELAARTGLATSALRFYEAEGLIHARRAPSGHRRYPRETLRRVAFLRAAQTVGLSLDEIRATLARLPDGRTPSKADWEQVSRRWRPLLDARIAELVRLRDELAECIGCGCLSLRSCSLYNRGDRAARLGPGARYLLGDRPDPEELPLPGSRRRRTR
jgi:MerR family redox-sensitive transcriptional activator SoxR